jgi:large conductance mechanosensitive channel
VLKDFREFILRGNVVDLAVGVVIGAAFGTVIASFVSNILTPIISLPGGTNFGDLAIEKDGKPFVLYGQFINDVIAFLLIALAVFFFVVKPINALMSRRKTEPDVTATTKDCPECASSIPVQARRCAFCTSQVA